MRIKVGMKVTGYLHRNDGNHKPVAGVVVELYRSEGYRIPMAVVEREDGTRCYPATGNLVEVIEPEDEGFAEVVSVAPEGTHVRVQFWGREVACVMGEWDAESGEYWISLPGRPNFTRVKHDRILPLPPLAMAV